MTDPRDLNSPKPSVPKTEDGEETRSPEHEEPSGTLPTSTPELPSLPPLSNPWDSFSTEPPDTKTFSGSAPSPFPAAQNASQLNLPLQAGRYVLTKEIAHGGMGAILLAEDEQFHRSLAIKVLLGQIDASSRTGQRFFEEAQVMGQLQHPGIPPVHELGTLPGGRPFFSMKLIEGETLADQLKRRTNPNEALPHFLDVFEQICQTIGYAHSRGVIHRDLKPGNVMVGAFGEVQVMDWGLAKVLGQGTRASGIAEDLDKPDTIKTVRSAQESSRTHAGSVMGTPAYMPPEQARGEIENLDERADVFGLGAIFCEILTGKPPYEGPTALQQAQDADLKNAFTALDECGADEELIQITRACLSEKKEDRPRDGAELAQLVSSYQTQVRERLEQEKVQRVQADEEQKRLTLKVTEERRRRRISLVLALVGVLFIAALSGGGLWYYQDQAQRRAEELQQQAEQRRAEERKLKLQMEAEEEVTRAVNRADNALDDLVGKLQSQNEFHKLMSRLSEWDRQLANCEAEVNKVVGIIVGNPTLINVPLQQRTRALQDRIRTERTNFDACAMLDDARLKSSVLVDGKLGISTALPEYRRVFRDVLHLDVEHGDFKAIAAQIRQSSIRLILVAHLDQWAIATTPLEGEPEPTSWSKIFRVVQRSDVKNEWRDRLRRAWEERDREAFPDLIRTLNPSEQNPHILAAFVMLLEQHRLHRTQVVDHLALHFESDFWLQYSLGVIARDPVEQINSFRSALTIRQAPVVYYSLGIAYQHHGDLDKASRYFLKAIHLDTDFAHAHNNLGNVYLDQGQVDKAIPRFLKVIELDPSSAFAHSNLGTAYDSKGDFDKAIRAYLKAIACDPKYAYAHYNLGNTWAAKGDMDNAIRHYLKAVDLEPDNVKFQTNLGATYSDQGKVDKAIHHLLKAVEIDPQSQEAHSGLCNAYRIKGNGAKAIEHGIKSIALAPKNHKARTNLGNAYKANRESNKAIQSYLQALALNPKDAKAHSGLGDVHSALGNLDKTIFHYSQVIALEPGMASAHYDLGNPYRVKGEVEKSLSEYHKVVKLDPKHAMAHTRLGLIYKNLRALDDTIDKNMRALDKAIQHFRKAIEADPKTIVAYGALGETLLKRGKFTEAKEVTQTCLDLLSKDSPHRPVVEQQLERCTLKMFAENRLSQFDKQERKLTDPFEMILLALLCQEPYKQRYLQATGLYQKAFRVKPSLEEDLDREHRYNAACAAVLTSAGRGKDTLGVKEDQRVGLRKQSLKWLQADLAAYEKIVGANPKSHQAIQSRLRFWQKDHALASVRDPEALEKLPKAEKDAWKKLWDNHRNLLRRVANKK